MSAVLSQRGANIATGKLGHSEVINTIHVMGSKYSKMTESNRSFILVTNFMAVALGSVCQMCFVHL